jgi:ribonucleoside-diphosphate reductase beta chain
MTNSVLTLTTQSNKLFFGQEGHGLARYDIPRYPILKKINEKMKSLFWSFDEIDMSAEKSSFLRMSDAEKFVFTENIKRQILLDSIQGRSPALVFQPAITDPTLENCFVTLGFFEQIHSQSYTHILQAIFPNPSIVYDGIPDIIPIADCAGSITSIYDRMITNPTKENLYLALIAMNALEGVRFFSSFSCSFSFGERGLVEGSVKQIKFIARDEAQHLALVQHVLKLLPKDDPEFIQIMGDLRSQAIALFDETAQQEKDWCKHIFQHGSILGLNEKILSDYIDYLVPRRKASAGLSTTTNFTSENPIPWVTKWFTDSNYQNAPQEVEGTAYLTSSLKNDISELQFDL